MSTATRPVSALTPEQAEARAAALDVEVYVLRFDLLETGPTFEVDATVRFTAHEPETFVEVVADQLHSATLDGVDLDLGLHDGRRLPITDLTGGEHELVVRARMRYSHDGEGLHHFVDPADGATYVVATGAVDNAARWFPCFDQPDLKARYEVEVRCPAAWTVLGNGVAERLGDDDGVAAWRLAPTPPIATYHLTLAAGPWHGVVEEHHGRPFGVHARASLAAELDRDAAELIGVTADAFPVMHELFAAPYPFGAYHQVFVPEFNWGAMENPGCVTISDRLLFRGPATASERLGRITTVVHELAHMWFGDLVTMRWWNDMWLNESFAEYLGHRVAAVVTDLPAWADFDAERRAWGYAADRRRSTHPVAGEGGRDAASSLEDFDGISYAKGAAVLRALASWLGDATFLAGLRRHIATHAFGNATFADLLGAWAAELAARGDGPEPADLTRWAQSWLRRAGVDRIAVADVDDDAVTLERREPVTGDPAPRPHAFTVAVEPGGPRVPARLDGDRVRVELAVAAGAVVVPNAGDETWATVRLSPADWTRLPQVLPRVLDTATRVVLWNALRTAVEDGLTPPAVWLDTVVAGLPDEEEVVAEPVWHALTLAWPRFVAPGAERDAGYARLAQLASACLDAAAPGSSRQRSAARWCIDVTPDLAGLRAWTLDAEPVPGLRVDVDLHWAVLARRAGRGDLEPAEIDAALRADPTSNGAVQAARVRTRRPDPAAKAAAWAAVVAPSSASQTEVGALAAGIWVAGQEDLVADYALRWFDEVGATAAFRSGWSLAEIPARCFPHLAVDAAVLAAAERFAAREDLPVPLRRKAADGADEMRRALAVRAAAAGDGEPRSG